MNRILLIISALLILPSCLFAQDEGRPQMLFNSGLTVQLGPEQFRDNWYPGFNFGAGLDIYMSYKWDLNLSFEYQRFFLKEDNYKEANGFGNEITINGNSATVFTANLNGKIILVEEGTKIPYLIVGLGLFKYSEAQMEIYEGHRSIETRFSHRKYSLGLNTGIGIELPIHLRFHLFGELKYHIGFTENITQIIPIKIGFKLK